MHRERTPSFSNDDTAALPARSGLVPSTGLLTAALAGLLAFGASGCDEDENGNPICEPTTPPPAAPAAPTGMAPQTPPTTTTDGGTHMAPTAAGGAADPVVGEEVEGSVSLAQLQANCDARGGYMQVHAACAGANDCQGFSYHSGEPGTLTEHGCKAVNGCTGASCVVGPAERTPQRTGKQIYEDDTLPSFGPASCINCHAVWGMADANGVRPPTDTTKFKLFLQPGSTRTASNWLQITPFEQEGIVAFGRTTTLSANGMTLESMKGYHKLLSRGEIKRVVEYIRTLTPVVTPVPIPK